MIFLDGTKSESTIGIRGRAKLAVRQENLNVESKPKCEIKKLPEIHLGASQCKKLEQISWKLRQGSSELLKKQTTAVVPVSKFHSR